MTAVSNAIFEAAQFNTHVRDNLLECAPAKATVVDRLIVTNGANTLREQSMGLQAWTPTWSGLTVGDGSLSAQCKVIFGIVVWRLKFTLGPSSAVTGPVSFSLAPSFPPLGGENGDVGGGWVNDASSLPDRRVVRCRITSSLTTAQLFFDGGVVNSGTPFAWDDPDLISVSGVYLTGSAF